MWKGFHITRTSMSVTADTNGTRIQTCKTFYISSKVYHALLKLRHLYSACNKGLKFRRRALEMKYRCWFPSQRFSTLSVLCQSDAFSESCRRATAKATPLCYSGNGIRISIFFHMEAVYNVSTVAWGVAEDGGKGRNTWGYHWANLLLGGRKCRGKTLKFRGGREDWRTYCAEKSLLWNKRTCNWDALINYANLVKSFKESQLWL